MFETVKKRKDFVRMRQAEFFNYKYFYIQFEKTKEDRHFGITVTKKLGKAVVRNFIKRRLRHLITMVLQQSKISVTIEGRGPKVPLGNYVFIAKKGIAEVKFADLEHDILNFFKKLDKEND